MRERALLDDLEKVCRKLPRGILPASSFGKNEFPEVTLFKQIHMILDQLDLPRKKNLVPNENRKHEWSGK